MLCVLPLPNSGWSINTQLNVYLLQLRYQIAYFIENRLCSFNYSFHLHKCIIIDQFISLLLVILLFVYLYVHLSVHMFFFICFWVIHVDFLFCCWLQFSLFRTTNRDLLNKLFQFLVTSPLCTEVVDDTKPNFARLNSCYLLVLYVISVSFVPNRILPSNPYLPLARDQSMWP